MSWSEAAGLESSAADGGGDEEGTGDREGDFDAVYAGWADPSLALSFLLLAVTSSDSSSPSALSIEWLFSPESALLVRRLRWGLVPDFAILLMSVVEHQRVQRLILVESRSLSPSQVSRLWRVQGKAIEEAAEATGQEHQLLAF